MHWTLTSSGIHSSLTVQITPCNNLLKTDLADLRIKKLLSSVSVTLVLSAEPAVSHMAVWFGGTGGGLYTQNELDRCSIAQIMSFDPHHELN